VNVIKEGYKITVTGEEGTVLGDIELGGYNLDKPIARSVLVDDIKDALPSEAFDPPGEGSSPHHSNPGPDQVAQLRAELVDLRDEAFNRHRGVVLSDWVTSPESPGIVINEERAKATPCKCFTYKGKDYCYSAGIIGMLEAGQVPTYCPTKEYEVRPGIKQRFEEFAEAAEAAHERIEEIPKGERLIPWLTEMGKELRARGIEV